MKKMLTIVLALALVFSVAGSAFAFTGITEEETSAASKFSVKVELVDYNYGWKDGIYYTTPINRAYAINEVVGALVTVVVPAKSEELVTVKISQSNMKILGVDTDVKDTNIVDPFDPDTDTLPNGKIAWKTENEEAYLGENDSTSNKTYKFFVTAQLKSDKGGSITAKIVDTDDDTAITAGILVADGRFEVTYNETDREYSIIAQEAGDDDDYKAGDGLIIKVDRNYFCKTMKLFIAGDPDATPAIPDKTYTLATVNGKIAFKAAAGTYVVSGDDDYSDLLAAYNELADEFGFDYTASGYLYKSFFTKLDGSVTVSDTAYVEPALPSSALLPDLAVTIPQTGSVSFAGFAMIALAVAAAVAVKKAR